MADRLTGALAEPFEPESEFLTAAICWILDDPLRHIALVAASKRRAELLCASERVAGLYAVIYRFALLL